MLRLLSVSAILLCLGFAPVPCPRLPDDPDEAIDRFDRETRGRADAADPAQVAKSRDLLVRKLANLEDRLRKTGAADAAVAVRDRVTLLKSLDPDRPLGDDSARDVVRRASGGGKYKQLLHVLHVPSDRTQFGDKPDFGYWHGTAYNGYADLKPGHWVYVYPRWFVWNEGPQR